MRRYILLILDASSTAIYGSRVDHGVIMLTNAFVVERADGSIKGYNCCVVNKGRRLELISTKL